MQLSESGRTGQSTGENINCNLISRKFDALMRALDITNVRLARVLNMDSSLISRWRNGFRKLRRDHQIVGPLTEYLARQMMALKEQDGGADSVLREILSGRDGDALEDMVEAVHVWMFTTGETSLVEGTPLDGLLAKISGWQGDMAVPDALIEALTAAPRLPELSTYKGNEGLRNAVTRFLTDVAVSEEKRHLRLFSNQSMVWMIEDEAFLQRWSKLMMVILSRGHTIEIIHNFGRSDTEVIVAVEQWLPLYMSGRITSFICADLDKTSVPLAHTMFIDTEHAAIHGSLIKGLEDKASYSYLTGQNSIESLEHQYDTLVSYCQRLLAVRREHRTRRLIAEIIESISQREERSEDVAVVLMSDLPAAVLREDELREAMADAGWPEATAKLALADYASTRGTIEACNRRQTLRFMLPIDGVYAGERLNAIFSDQTLGKLPLKPHLIKAVATRIRAGSSSYRGVLLTPIRRVPFPDLNIILLPNRRVFIERMQPPSLVMHSENEVFLRRFGHYLQSLT